MKKTTIFMTTVAVLLTAPTANALYSIADKGTWPTDERVGRLGSASMNLSTGSVSSTTDEGHPPTKVTRPELQPVV